MVVTSDVERICMSPEQLDNIVKTFMKTRDLYRENIQLFNKAISFYEIDRFYVECLTKYYILNSDDFNDWVNDKKLSELSLGYTLYWDANIRKRLVEKINKYINFYISPLPLNDRPAVLAYFAGRELAPLIKNGIDTMGKIFALPNVDLLSELPGVGRKTIRMVKEVIEDIRSNS